MAHLSDRNIHRDSPRGRYPLAIFFIGRIFGNDLPERYRASQRYRESIVRSEDLFSFRPRIVFRLRASALATSRLTLLYLRWGTSEYLIGSSTNPASFAPPQTPLLVRLSVPVAVNYLTPAGRPVTYTNQRVSEILVFFVYVSLSRTISMYVKLWALLCHELYQRAVIILGIGRECHKFNLSQTHSWMNDQISQTITWRNKEWREEDRISFSFCTFF